MDSISTISPAAALNVGASYAASSSAGTAAAAHAQGTIPVSHANPSTAAASIDDLKAAVAERNKAFQGQSHTLEFQIDENSKHAVVKIVDTSTQEVLRQMPSPEFLRMAANIDAYQAHLLHEKA